MNITDYLGQFVRRIIQDALSEATPAYWLRRARAFEDARPRPGDFNGHTTAAELAERDRRCAALANNCRRHAEMMRDPSLWADEIALALREVA